MACPWMRMLILCLRNGAWAGGSPGARGPPSAQLHAQWTAGGRDGAMGASSMRRHAPSHDGRPLAHARPPPRRAFASGSAVLLGRGPPLPTWRAARACHSAPASARARGRATAIVGVATRWHAASVLSPSS